MKSEAVEPSLGLSGGSDCWDDDSGTRDICVNNAPRINIKAISIIRRLEIKEDVFVLDFMLSISESSFGLPVLLSQASRARKSLM